MSGGHDDTVASTLPGGTDAAAVAEVVAGRYRIVRWLGGGGMGRVYEALDIELGERVALKVLRANLSEEAVERFRREVRLTRRIQHRNVARMFDIGDHHGDKFLTMELVQGEPLTRELAARMAWPRLQQLAVQICDGLAAAHAAGVVHRDLKPDNVLVERGTDRAVITDFGIARSGDDASVTQVGVVIGTPRYMAPEQLAGIPDIDARADLFSLGVMLYELACGARPWAGDNPIAIAVVQATHPPRPLHAPHVPVELVELVMSCLALDRT
ncbi:MAG: serine/threonine protein kinase, partial [Myxococcota bacterium]|nr:serine/threonine protein kinase [Myxococcota bacterium]